LKPKTVISLDDPACADPAVAGAKAAWLARGRQAGLPVLPGVVVTTSVSQWFMDRGVDVLAIRGSGGARLAVSQAALPEPVLREVTTASARLGEPMVVRSSSILEGSGEWSGAFTSYLEVLVGEVATAILGCWASAFTVHTLERYAAAGLEPGSAPMAVLIQRALEPDFGGTARISGDDTLVVGVAGSPAPLVQGWEPGSHARVSRSRTVTGEAALDLMGADIVLAVADSLQLARDAVGATACEWAVIGTEVFLLQLMRPTDPDRVAVDIPDGLSRPSALTAARLVRRAPGPMGEMLVLPWVMAMPDILGEQIDPIDIDPLEALAAAYEHARALTAEAWRLPKQSAIATAAETLRNLRGPEPGGALDAIERLRPADPDRSRLVLGLLARVRHGLVAAGAVSQPDLGWHIEPKLAQSILEAGRADQLRTRIGFDRWEPFDVGVVIAHGTSADGTAAAPGMAAGRLCFIADPHDTAHFRPRDVVVGTHPVPNLAALLWDAAALVTTGGGPGAHLFESARALAIPAVCGIHLDEALGTDLTTASLRTAVAVDGSNGRVTVTPW
jgi:Pyruvate phosphate dikinase, AMP/ATP-binding domain/PEP-utilising enzyme, mobile domain